MSRNSIWDWLFKIDVVVNMATWIKSIFTALGGTMGGMAALLYEVKWPVWVLLIMAGAAIGMWLYNEIAFRRLSRRAAQIESIPTMSAEQPGTNVFSRGFEFIESRHQLGVSHPLRTVLEEAREVWLIAATGYNIYISDAHKLDSLRRGQVLLPHPDCPAVASVARAIGKDTEEIRDQVVKASDGFIKAGVPVRWADHREFFNTLLIVNPKDTDSWAQVEILMPGLETYMRPSFRIHKDRFPKLYDALKKGFEEAYKRATDAREQIRKFKPTP